MRGLIEKDVCLLLKQKKIMVMYLVVAFMLSFTMDSSFIVSYFSLIGALLVLTTLSYDSYDNGLPFLMSLPIDAKTYVYAKYLFSLIGLLVAWCLSVVVQFIAMAVQNTPIDILDTLQMDLAFIPVFILIISVSIPISLKFGVERSRIILLAIGGICMVMFFLGKKLLDFLGTKWSFDLTPIMEKVISAPKETVTVVALAAGCIAGLLSAAISVHVMKNKEY